MMQVLPFSPSALPVGATTDVAKVSDMPTVAPKSSGGWRLVWDLLADKLGEGISLARKDPSDGESLVLPEPAELLDIGHEAENFYDNSDPFEAQGDSIALQPDAFGISVSPNQTSPIISVIVLSSENGKNPLLQTDQSRALLLKIGANYPDTWAGKALTASAAHVKNVQDESRDSTVQTDPPSEQVVNDVQMGGVVASLQSLSFEATPNVVPLGPVSRTVELAQTAETLAPIGPGQQLHAGILPTDQDVKLEVSREFEARRPEVAPRVDLRSPDTQAEHSAQGAGVGTGVVSLTVSGVEPRVPSTSRGTQTKGEEGLVPSSPSAPKPTLLSDAFAHHPPLLDAENGQKRPLHQSPVLHGPTLSGESVIERRDNAVQRISGEAPITADEHVKVSTMPVGAQAEGVSSSGIPQSADPPTKLDFRATSQTSNTPPPPPTPPQFAQAQHVAVQVRRVLGGEGSRGIDVQLAPEELGRLRLTLVGGDGVGHLTVHADRVETTDLLRRHVDVLAKELRNAGWTELSVDIGGREGREQQGRNFPSDPALYGRGGPTFVSTGSAEAILKQPADLHPRRSVGLGALNLRI